MKMRSIYIFPLLLFITCKSIDQREASLLELEDCIQHNSNNIDSLNACLNGQKYLLEGYILIDSIFYMTDYKNEARPIDSVPKNVIKAFSSDGKSCRGGSGVKVCEVRTDIDFKTERRFWVREGVDSIYTILRLY